MSNKKLSGDTIERLSGNALKIHKFLISFIDAKGYPPSVREICEGVGLTSTSTIHGHLRRLEKRGYIRRDPTKPRAIEILVKVDEEGYIIEPLNTQKEVLNVPIVGTIAAGTPILAIENIEDSFTVPADYFPGKSNLFFLKVRGESMIEAGIFENDLLLVEQCSTAENGDIVVALIEDSATVKRFFKEKGRIRLQPENSRLQPIYVKDCIIKGKAVGLIRKL